MIATPHSCRMCGIGFNLVLTPTDEDAVGPIDAVALWCPYFGDPRDLQRFLAKAAQSARRVGHNSVGS